MIPILRSSVRLAVGISSEGDLVCPRCKGNHLHHTNVKVFERGEDAEQTLVTEVLSDNLLRKFVESEYAGNPSTRRDGVRIGFYCELCAAGNSDTELDLAIAQHQGQSMLFWIYSVGHSLLDLRFKQHSTPEKLAALLMAKDDSVHRQLRVTKDGVAYLSDKVGLDDLDNVLFRLETWAAGTGNCGPESVKDDRWVMQVHRDITENWPKPKAEYIDY